MTTAHTPGPWHANGRWVEDNSGGDIAEVVGAFNDPGEDRLTEEGPYNLALLAAAPEMLYLLKDIAFAFEQGGLRRPKGWHERINRTIAKTTKD
jgi:hypothetical protein